MSEGRLETRLGVFKAGKAGLVKITLGEEDGGEVTSGEVGFGEVSSGEVGLGGVAAVDEAESILGF